MYHCFSAMGNTVDGKFAFGTWDPRCCYTPMMVLIDEAAGCEDEAACPKPNAPGGTLVEDFPSAI